MVLKRLAVLILALVHLLPLCGQAEAGEWTCPNCSQAGNTGNFCGNCGTTRPSADWICPDCGQNGNTGNFCSNCGKARPDANAAPTEAPAPAVTVNNALEQIPGETERVKVITNRVNASSFIANKKNPNLWIPENAIDGNETTCWQFSAKKGLK